MSCVSETLQLADKARLCVHTHVVVQMEASGKCETRMVTRLAVFLPIRCLINESRTCFVFVCVCFHAHAHITPCAPTSVQLTALLGHLYSSQIFDVDDDVTPTGRCVLPSLLGRQGGVALVRRSTRRGGRMDNKFQSITPLAPPPRPPRPPPRPTPPPPPARRRQPGPRPWCWRGT